MSAWSSCPPPRGSEEDPTPPRGRRHSRPSVGSVLLSVWTPASLANRPGHRVRGLRAHALAMPPRVEQPCLPHPRHCAVPFVLTPKSQGDNLFLLPEEAEN